MLQITTDMLSDVNKDGDDFFLGMIRKYDPAGEATEEVKDSEEKIYVDVIEVIVHQSKCDVIISTNGSLISYKLDTGAETKVLLKAIFNELKEKPKSHYVRWRSE